MSYIAIKNFASLDHNGMVQIGEEIEIPNKRTAEKLQNKGLVFPTYGTKEDKRAIKIERKSPKGDKVTIKHDAGAMFFVLRGTEIVDRLQKKKAQKLADELNKQ